MTTAFMRQHRRPAYRSLSETQSRVVADAAVSVLSRRPWQRRIPHRRSRCAEAHHSTLSNHLNWPVADAIKDVSKRKGIVLDPFGGSGTTIIAAEKTGRRARAIELDPKYVDVAVRRWERYTGKTAVLDGTGQTFEDVEAARIAANDAARSAERPREGRRGLPASCTRYRTSPG